MRTKMRLNRLEAALRAFWALMVPSKVRGGFLQTSQLPQLQDDVSPK